MNLQSLFAPQSILVTGVSTSSDKVGHIIAKNVLESGYKGDFFQLNPKASEILNRPVCNSLKDVDKPIDVDIIAIPKDYVLDHIHELVQHKKDHQYSDKVTFAVIVSAGFSESGNTALENQILELANQNQIRVVGPNCLGVLSQVDNNFKYNGSFTQSLKLSGGIALFSQSGALISSLITNLEDKNCGFSYIVSLGNQADLNIVDFIEYARQDPKTRVIGVYAESLSQGQDLLAAINSTDKPVVILKSGVSAQSKEAASSHTGSIAGDFDIAKMYVTKAGGFITSDFQEFVNLAYTFATKV
jgi:acyl-CoA synthetase (NDP forming)